MYESSEKPWIYGYWRSGVVNWSCILLTVGVSTNDLKNLDPWRVPPFSLCDWQKTWRRRFIVQDRSDHAAQPRTIKPVIERKHQLRPGPADLQLLVGRCRLGGYSICLYLTGVLLWPPRRPPWTACVHFRDSDPINVSHLRFNFLCLLLL
jgi:hypothetical protein